MNSICPWTSVRIYRRLLCLVLVSAIPMAAFGAIRFEEVSKKAGVLNHGPTAASAWGDYNNDGWPDLWVSNHHGKPPNLYLNRQDGTFFDIADKVLADTQGADFHGGAWADFDNDSDQDLIVITGGGAGRGVGANYLFVNEHGKLVNKAVSFGLDYPLGRGRTPLWLDADRDGKLDVLLMNRPRAEAPSAIFIQTTRGFIQRNREFGFPFSQRSPSDSILSRIRGFFSFLFSAEVGGIEVSDEFAQLADLSSDSPLELVAYMQPMRIYSTSSSRFHDITADMVFPDLRSVQDAAIEDFNGDGRFDWYLTRSRPGVSDVVQTGAAHLQGKMASKPNQSKAILFTTEGKITFGIYQPWMDPSDTSINKKPDLFIGSRRLELSEPIVTISPDDPAVREPVPAVAEQTESISIQFDPETAVWTFKSTAGQINFVITSTMPIETLETQGFKPSKGDLKNILLINKGNEFISQPLGATDDVTACGSVVAGDFDNDMDMDLYLVCSGPTENLPNLLYENDGHGRFVKVPQAGGAEGSAQGRGNQAVTADFDRDGFLDVFVTNGAGPQPFSSDGPHQLFHNRGNDNHWIEIDLQGVASNRDGIGAKIVLETGGKVQVRQQGGGMHSFSQNHARIHFGLGVNKKVDRLTIYWPSGTVQELNNVQGDQILLVKESAAAH